MMRDFRIIEKWIEDGEGARIDFKTAITSLPKIAKSLVAFANSRGGRIVVGVEDKGAVLGVDVEGEKYQLESAAEKFTRPKVALTFEELRYRDKIILVAEVAESKTKPHFAVNKIGEERLLIRQLDKCVSPDPLVKNVLLSGKMNNLQRTGSYHRSKRELIDYLKRNNEISLPAYQKQHALTEKSAQRVMIDFLMDGFLKTKSRDPLVVELA